LNNIISQVKRNCNISDAKFWGEYSICGLLLRLRELYRCEKGLKLWERVPQEDISEWMSEKENIWKELQNKELEDLIIGGSVFGPFEVSDINKRLEEENIIYGAGYGIRKKPSFFLADLVSKRKIDGYEVYIAGNEYARDLADYPAMIQDNIIFARIATTKLRIWERFEELRVRDPKGPLSYAFSRYGINPHDEPSEDIEKKVSLTASSEIETFIYHEIGEAIEDENLGEEWKELILELSGRKAEFFSRGIKDLLADTTEKGMINYIIKNQKEGSLGFYIVFLDGYRRLLFPEIIKAFEKFIESGDWKIIEDARIEGYKKAKGYAERLLSIKREISDRLQLTEYIEKEIVDKIKAVKS
ncbi:MAG: Sfum_1244 family protein, partial [Thermodesulfovibrionales bacterium]